LTTTDATPSLSSNLSKALWANEKVDANKNAITTTIFFMILIFKYYYFMLFVTDVFDQIALLCLSK
jgi:hypothetical protein